MSASKLPHAIDAEEAVIGGILLDNNVADRVFERCDALDFFRDQHRLIVTVMYELHRHGDPIDLVTVTDELRRREQLATVGGAAFVAELLERVPTSANAGYHARIVREHAERRRGIQQAQLIAEKLSTGVAPMRETLPPLMVPLFDLLDEQVDRRPLAEAVTDVYSAAERASADREAGKEPAYIPTGFREIDKYIGGAMAGDMLVIGARTSVGKSSLAMAIARNAAESGRRAEYFSLEMENELLIQRALSQLGGVNLQRIRMGMLTAAELGLLAEASERLAALPLGMHRWPRSWPRVQMGIRRAVHDGAELIVVDYLGRLELPGSRAPKNERIGEISHQLKELAHQLQVPIYAAAQINREVGREKDKRPQLLHLRDSGDIEQDADVVILMHRPAMYEAKSARDLMECIIAKQRNGPQAIAELQWIADSANLCDYPESAEVLF